MIILGDWGLFFSEGNPTHPWCDVSGFLGISVRALFYFREQPHANRKRYNSACGYSGSSHGQRNGSHHGMFYINTKWINLAVVETKYISCKRSHFTLL